MAGGYLYVEDEYGRRVICPHQDERNTIIAILGKDCPSEVVKLRTGLNSSCICLDCLEQFEADLRDEVANPWRYYYGAVPPGTRCESQGQLFAMKKPLLSRRELAPEWQKDERKCPHCCSENVKTVFELIGEACPRCKTGVIEEQVTDIIS